MKNYIKSIFRVFLLSLFFSQALFAKKLAPHQAAELAEKRPELLEMLEYRKQAEYLHQKGQLLWQNPRANLDGGQKLTDSSSGSTFAASFQVPIVNPLRYAARKNVVQTNRNMQKLESELLRRQVAFDAFYVSVALRVAYEKGEHLKERMHRFRLIRTYMKSRPFASSRQQAERGIVASHLMLLEQEGLSIEHEKIKWQQRLAFLTGEPQVEVDLQWADVFDIPIDSLIIKNLSSNNYELALLKAAENVETSRAAMYQKMIYPDFSLGSFYSQETAGPPEHFYGLSFSFEIPVANSGKVAADEARARAGQKKSELLYRTQELEAQLKEQLALFHLQQEQLKSLPMKLADKLDTQLNTAEKFFKQGKIDLMTFLEVESNVHEAQHLLYDARLNMYTTLLQIEFLIGQRNPHYTVSLTGGES